MALAIAAEFAAQKSTVVSATTPLVSCTAVCASKHYTCDILQYNMACMAIDAYNKDDLKMQAAAADIDAALRKSGQKNVAVTRTDDPVAPPTEIPEIDRVAAQLSTTSAFGEDPNRPEIRYGTRTPGQASAMSSVGMGGETQRLREMTKDYLETDTVCYRVSLGTGDPDEALLRRRQDKYYDPLVQWWEGAFAGKLGVTEGLGDVQHPTSSYEACEAVVDAGDHFFRSALHTCLGATKSTVISFALLHGHITVEQAFAACRVEEEYQIEVNGFVEDGHDTTRIQSRIQLGAAGTLMWLSPASRPEAPASDPAGVAAQMEARMQAVAVRRSRDVVQNLLADEAAASMRARALAATGSSATDAELADDEDSEIAWMESELLALQRNSNRMAQQAGLEVPYPEAAAKDARADAAKIQ